MVYGIPPLTKTMPFVPKNVSVSNSTEFFANLTYLNPKTETKQLLSFDLKDCYSHFGAKPNSDGKTFSIGLTLEDQRQISRFNKLEARCMTLLPTKKAKGGKRLLKCLYEKGDQTTLYLKLSKDQMVGVKKGQTCMLNGKITFSAIYLGDNEKGYGPSIVIRVNRAELKLTKKRNAKDDDGGPSVSDSEEEDEAISDSDKE